MNRKRQSLVVLAAAAFAVAVAGQAFARQGGKPSKVRAVVAADAASTAAGASLDIRLIDASRGRWELRMQLHRAPTGLAPQAFIDDGTGALVLAGDFATSHESRGEYKFRLRGRDAATLPAGATTLADLGGRAFEVRDSGVALIAGTLPTLASSAAASSAASGADTTTSTTTASGSDDPSNHDANDDSATTGATGGGADDPANHDAADTSSAGSSAGSTAGGTTSTTTATGSSSGSNGHGGHGRGGHDGSGHR